jgi:hypothetical protein
MWPANNFYSFDPQVIEEIGADLDKIFKRHGGAHG